MDDNNSGPPNLDHLYSEDKLEWVGNANELGAAYAVDGYARVKHSLGVIISTSSMYFDSEAE